MQNILFVCETTFALFNYYTHENERNKNYKIIWIHNRANKTKKIAKKIVNIWFSQNLLPTMRKSDIEQKSACFDSTIPRDVEANNDEVDLETTRSSDNSISTATSSENNSPDIEKSNQDYVIEGFQSLNSATNILNINEKFFVSRIKLAFYKAREQVPMHLNLENQIQAATTSNIDIKSVLASFMSKPIQRVVHFAKQLPDFGKLSAHDQVCLLRGGALEVIICSSSSLYDSIANKMTNMVSADRQVQGSDTSNIHMDLLKRFWSEEAFVKTIGFLKSMHALGIDETTLALFLPVIIFSPDRQGLINKSTITRMQSKYSFLLKKYIMNTYEKQEQSIHIYTNMCLLLDDLRHLQALHRTIFGGFDPFRD